MSIQKQAKDRLIKFVLGKSTIPQGLNELNKYFRIYGPINFTFEKQLDGSFVAMSKDFKYGSIVTSAKNREGLDEKVHDAILTAFEVPSSYAQEAAVHRVGDRGYAFA
ncbi:MAG: hypothetical protein ABH826_03045 [Patescibacteria group bacterium]|nr:hypothetical protein [Patescibacteria group bacterium]